MWPESITPCVCEQPGWCARHRCLKPEPFHRLCRQNRAYFDAWEQGEGPCADQFFAEAPAATNKETPPAEPGLLRKVWNFGKAVVRHIADGAERVDDETFQARLTICRTCPSCDVERMVCRQPACGCVLEAKASWRSEACPLGKWPAAITSSEEIPTPAVTPPAN